MTMDDNMQRFHAALIGGETDAELAERMAHLRPTKPVPEFNPPKDVAIEPFEPDSVDDERMLAVFLTLDPRVRELTRRERYLWEVQTLDTYCDNGGLDSYIRYAGDRLTDCMEALSAIGAMGTYQLLRQVCDLFPDGLPAKDESERWDQMESILGDKECLEDLEFDWGGDDDSQLMMKYWDENG